MNAYAVVEVAGKQFLVKQGDVVKSELLKDTEVGQSIVIDKVLLYSDGNEVKIGTPYLEDASISCKIDAQIKEKKILTFKYRRRNSSQTRRGHRQQKMKLTIDEIKG